MTLEKTRVALLAIGLLIATGGLARAGIIEDTSGLLYHLDAGAGVTQSGGFVSTWADQGTLGNDFTAPGGKEPTFVASSIGGLPGLQFSGAQELLLSTSTQPRTVIAVTNVAAYTSLDGIWGSENADKGIRLRSNTTYATTSNGDGNDFPKGNYNGVRVNGLVTPSITVGLPHVLAETWGPSHTSTYGTTSIGEYFAGRGYQGDVAELAVYDRVLSNSEIVAIENDLGGKYGITTHSAPAIPGTLIGGLIGGDLTDPENDATAAGANLNGTVTATVKQGFGGENFGNVFTNTNSKYCCNGPTQSVTFQFDDGRRATLAQYTLTSSNDSPQRDPIDWTISGSNDGVNFTPIHTVVGTNNPGSGDDTIWGGRNQTIRFDGGGADFDTPTQRYNSLRFEFTRTDQDGALNEIEYFGTLSGPILSPGGDGVIGTEQQGSQGGRFISVKNNGTASRTLHISEIEAGLVGSPLDGVFGVGDGTSTNDVAVMALGASFESRIGNIQHGSDNGPIDGDQESGGAVLSILGVTGGGNEYVLDLGSIQNIGEIRTLGRADNCCGDRLSDYTVSLLADNGGSPGAVIWSESYPGTNPLYGEFVSFILPDLPVSIVDYTLPTDGELLMDVDAASGQADLLTVSGLLTVGGILDVSNIGGEFQVGQTFNLLDFGSIAGTFSQVGMPATGAGGWDLTKLYIDGTVTFVPEPSTFALACLALFGLVFGGRRRKRAA